MSHHLLARKMENQANFDHLQRLVLHCPSPLNLDIPSLVPLFVTVVTAAAAASFCCRSCVALVGLGGGIGCAELNWCILRLSDFLSGLCDGNDDAFLLPIAKWLMLRLTEDCWDCRDRGRDTSCTAGKSTAIGFLRGLASWSRRDIEYALPGDRVNGFRVGAVSRVGIVGIRSVRRRKLWPLAQPAGVCGCGAPVGNNNQY